MAESNQRNQYKAVVISEARGQKDTNEPFKKVNGNLYYLQNVKITEGPLKGAIVPGTVTTFNQETGRERGVFEEGFEVVAYHSMLPSTSEPGKFKHFFDLGSDTMSTSDDDLTAMLTKAAAGVTPAVGVAPGTTQGAF